MKLFHRQMHELCIGKLELKENLESVEQELADAITAMPIQKFDKGHEGNRSQQSLPLNVWDSS